MPLTDDQFVQLLEGFADLDIFNGNDTPVIFVVYAHNNEGREARAGVVHLLIKWLKAIRARAISDKSPLLSSVVYTDSAPAENILDNQFRLLPACGSDEVRKVILCGSEVLQCYWADPFTDGYVKSILSLHQPKVERRQFQDNVRKLVQNYSGKPKFHHVLTELAFLQIRKEVYRTNHGIIPVALTGGDVRQYLPFVEACDVFLKDQDHDPRKMFFKLLKRIFVHARGPTVIDEIDKCYTKLGGKDKILDRDVNIHVHNCISNMIRDGSAALRTQNRNHDSTTTRHFMVPFGRNKNFVGRNAILEQLLEKIPPDDNQDDCQRTAIEGLGGIGKTQIALEAAYRVRNSYPDCSVYWVPVIDLTSFKNAYREIGQLLQLPGIENDKADVKLLVKAGLSQKSASSWLLIVDNADDLELLNAVLADYLPFSREGSILFTTRDHKTTAKLDIAREHILVVSEMNDAEATDLLQKGLRKEQMDNTERMQYLLNFLTNLPLAIKQASAFIASNTNVTVSEYLEICKSSDADLIDMLSKEFEDCYRYKDYAKNQNPVATTWWISFEYISRQDYQAAGYLKFISLLAEKDIPQSLLPVASTSKIEIKKAISTLQAYAFIIERNTPSTFDMHRLVRLSMRNWLRGRGEWETWTTNVVQRFTEVYPFLEHENRKTWMKYLPHGQAVLEIDGVTGTKGDTILLSKIASSYGMLGKYSKSEQLYRKTLELTEKVRGKEHPYTLSIMDNFAIVLRQQGNYEQAKKMHQKALAGMEKVLGKEHPYTLNSMDNFAIVLQQQGNYEQAKKMHQKVLEIREKVPGKKHPDTLNSMNILANCHTVRTA